MKKKTRVLIISYTAALVAALAIGLIACRTDANRRQTAMDANYRHAYGEVLNAVQELDSSLQKSLYATTAAMKCPHCTDIYSNAQTAEMALGVLPVSRNAAEGKTFTSEELEHLRAFSDATTQLSTQLAALGQSLYDGAVTTTAHMRSTESLENLGQETDLSGTLRAFSISLLICSSWPQRAKESLRIRLLHRMILPFGSAKQMPIGSLSVASLMENGESSFFFRRYSCGRAMAK